MESLKTHIDLGRLPEHIAVIMDGNGRWAKAASHQGKGWEQFTDKVIHVINEQRDGVVFMLWGAYAQRKGAFIDQQRHLVLKAPHPSPLSSHRGFFGCKHFSQANAYLQGRGETAIDWSLP